MKELNGDCIMKLLKEKEGRDSNGNELSFYLWELEAINDKGADCCIPVTYTITARLNGEEAALDRWIDYDYQAYTDKNSALKELQCCEFLFL